MEVAIVRLPYILVPLEMLADYANYFLRFGREVRIAYILVATG